LFSQFIFWWRLSRNTLYSLNTVASNHFHSIKKTLFSSTDHAISMECKAFDFQCQCTQQKLQSIYAVLTFDPQLKKILTFSLKDRYQLIYFICIVADTEVRGNIRWHRKSKLELLGIIYLMRVTCCITIEAHRRHPRLSRLNCG
jgi:hypothetical protein